MHPRSLLIPLILLGLSLFVGVQVLGSAPDASHQVSLPMLGNGVDFTTTPTPLPPPSYEGKPLANFDTADFNGPALCQSCHGNIKDAEGNDVTMSAFWRSTMMANAARDPFWQAKVSSEIQRHPEAQAHIEATCMRCHMPMAFTQARVDGLPLKIFGEEGFLNPDHPLHDAAMDGVSCTLCHQIQPDGLGEEVSFSGGYVIDTSTNPPRRPLFGPYPTPDMMGAGIMRSGSGYDPQYGAHLRTSELCAVCHTLFTPTQDAEGNPVNYPEQTPYLEWKHSAFGDGIGEDTPCQGCHMPQAPGPVAIYPGWTQHEEFSRHDFVGGNVFMLRILQQHGEALGVRASSDDFEATIQRTLKQLQEQTAEVQIREVTRSDEEMTFQVVVINKTGHKLPTGYPSRRTWLHVTITDAAGRTLFESGRPTPDGGILGDDATHRSDAYEPHHDIITSPDQVAIYQVVMGDAQGQVTYTLLDAVDNLKDNRLLPAGFDKATAGEAIAVKGSAAEDDNFIGGSDTVTYRVSLPENITGPLALHVELLYSSLGFEWMRDLRLSNTPEVRRFERYFNGADKTPTILAETVFTSP